MPDLVEKFFMEGLTEAEEQLLSDALWASEELTEKFAGLAQAAYTRYGYPEPQEPDGPSSNPGSGIKPWIGAGLFILGLSATYLGWNKWGGELKVIVGSWGIPVNAVQPRTVPVLNGEGLKSNQRSQSESLNTSKSNVEIRSKQTEQKSIEIESKSMDQDTSSPHNDMPAHRIQPGSETKQMKASISPSYEGQSESLTKVRIPSQPINLDQTSKNDYSSVSAVVHLSTPTALTVNVLDSKGIQIQPLYNGTLGPGHWVFEWDGHVSNGLKAGVGFYQIEVRAGFFVERKNVEIH